MIFTVSTVKDVRENAERWVVDNLSNGVDHMVVFLDGPAPRTRELLDAHPHVTCVRTDARWWADDRPKRLNGRQWVNANLTRVVLHRLGCATWLFHVDGDEVAVVDADELARLPDDTAAVRLTPYEAVARDHWDGPVTHFKRLLDPDQLELLRVLGLVGEATNARYFGGHTGGKAGMRPAGGRWLGIHDVVELRGGEVVALDHAALQRGHLAHFESCDRAEFVRKWSNLLGSGPKVGTGRGREPIHRAMRALLALDLPREDLEWAAGAVFDRERLDDLATLDRLGLLVGAEQVLPGGHVPQPLDPVVHERLAAALDSLRAAPKRAVTPQDHDEAGLAAVTDLVDRAVRADRPGGTV